MLKGEGNGVLITGGTGAILAVCYICDFYDTRRRRRGKHGGFQPAMDI